MDKYLYLFAWSKRDKQMESQLMEFRPDLWGHLKLRARFNIDRDITIYAIILDKSEADILIEEIKDGEIQDHLMELGPIEL